MANTSLQRDRAVEGMTIVEAVVAIVLFGIFIATATRVLISARESTGQAQDHYKAICLGKNRIERLQTSDFSLLEGWQTVGTGEVLDQEGNPTADGNFRLTVAVTSVTATLKYVLVTVKIRDRDTLEFDDEKEGIVTMLSNQRTRPE
jgi:type II secretory pathway pseudopilin PulG